MKPVIYLFAAVIALVVLVSVAAVIVYAPAHGINGEVVGYIYDVVKIMLGAVIAAAGYKTGRSER